MNTKPAIVCDECRTVQEVCEHLDAKIRQGEEAIKDNEHWKALCKIETNVTRKVQEENARLLEEVSLLRLTIQAMREQKNLPF